MAKALCWGKDGSEKAEVGLMVSWERKGLAALCLLGCLMLAVRRNRLGSPMQDSLGKLCSPWFPSLDELAFLEDWSLALFFAAEG